MTVGQLRKLIKGLPDDMVFLVEKEDQRRTLSPGFLTYAKAVIEPVWVTQWIKFNTYRGMMYNPERQDSFRRNMLVIRKDE